MRKQFDIKYRHQIESGEYKVETRDGRPVRVICWDRKGSLPLVVLVPTKNGDEYSYDYTSDGSYHLGTRKSEFDLFIVTPEPELSEFEKGCIRLYQDGRDDGFAGDNLSDENLKECSAKLLALARKELCESGEVTDWYAKGKAEALKEIEQDPESSYAFKRGVEYGKEEALKDLPRWIDGGLPIGHAMVDISGLCEFDFIRRHGKLLRISGIEKLPGFNENEK